MEEEQTTPRRTVVERTEVLPLAPKISNPRHLRYDKWLERYQYYIDSMFNNLQSFILSSICDGNAQLADQMYDWRAMHGRLERYLYANSANRFRAYTPSI